MLIQYSVPETAIESLPSILDTPPSTLDQVSVYEPPDDDSRSLGKAQLSVRRPRLRKFYPASEIITYESVMTMENLITSYRRVRRGKKKRKDVIRYHMRYLEFLTRLKNSLDDRTYAMGPLTRFKVYEPKERQVVANCFVDKIVQDVLAKQVLAKAIAPRVIYDNVASQPDKGTQLAIDRLRRNMSIHAKTTGWTDEGWVLVCDVKKYFYNIDHAIMLDMIRNLPIDDHLYDLIKMEVDACDPTTNPYNKEPGKGLCIGFEANQWCAIYYLDRLDHFIKEQLHIKCYGRYMDDFYIIHEDREYLEECLEKIREFLRTELKLELNSKTHMHPFSQGVCFLGYHLYYDTEDHRIHSYIRKKSIRKMLKRAKKLSKKVKRGKLDLDTAVMSLDAWYAYACHDESHKAVNAYHKALKMFEDFTHGLSVKEYLEIMRDPYNITPDGFFCLHRVEGADSRDPDGFYVLNRRPRTMADLVDSENFDKVTSNVDFYTERNTHALERIRDEAMREAKHRHRPRPRYPRAEKRKRDAREYQITSVEQTLTMYDVRNMELEPLEPRWLENLKRAYT